MLGLDVSIIFILVFVVIMVRAYFEAKKDRSSQDTSK